MKFVLLLAVTFFYSLCYAGNVDTLNVFSPSMKKNIRCVVITPDAKKGHTKPYPVLYLLHGFSGDYANWVRRVPELKNYVDDYQLIIVCPDAAFSSWYYDSPIDSTFRYETFTAKELPAFIDGKYNTIKDRSGRAITGLSMGGHGALYLGWRHANNFGAAGSMSGALVIDRITRGLHLDKRIGDTINSRHLHRTMSFMHEMETPAVQPVAIILDCGIDDFVIEMSRAAHKKMLELKIPHDYTERPGGHTWPYWRNSIKYHLLFFNDYFNKARTKEPVESK